MVRFEKCAVASTTPVYDCHGNLVYASAIQIGEQAWTAVSNAPLGKRIACAPPASDVEHPEGFESSVPPSVMPPYKESPASGEEG